MNPETQKIMFDFIKAVSAGISPAKTPSPAIHKIELEMAEMPIAAYAGALIYLGQNLGAKGYADLMTGIVLGTELSLLVANNSEVRAAMVNFTKGFSEATGVTRPENVKDFQEAFLKRAQT